MRPVVLGADSALGRQLVSDLEGAGYIVIASVESPAAVEELAALATPDARGSERPRLLTGDSPDGLVWAIGTATSTSTRLLVANLDSRERRIRVTHPAGALTLVVPSLSFVARDA